MMFKIVRQEDRTTVKGGYTSPSEAANARQYGETVEIEDISTAKEIRQWNEFQSECSTLGPLCSGCGEGNKSTSMYNGFCDAYETDEQPVECPRCGRKFYGYYIWEDADGTKAVWPFPQK